MTTCAYDGEILAADSRLSGEYTEDHYQKIFKVNSSHIAVVGTYSDCLLFVRWFKDQTKDKPDFKDSDDFCCLVIRQGDCYYYDCNCVEAKTRFPVAIGSGGSFALGAMAMGADAKKAIEVAKKYDSGTGGKVQTVKIK